MEAFKSFENTPSKGNGKLAKQTTKMTQNKCGILLRKLSVHNMMLMVVPNKCIKCIQILKYWNTLKAGKFSNFKD